MLKKSMKVSPDFSRPDVLYDKDDVQIIKATSEHAAYLQDHLRATDVRECMIHGATPWRALHAPLSMRGAQTWTGIYKGVPVCMFGVTPVVDDADMKTGLIWMLGTDVITTEYRKFLRLSIAVTDYLVEGYDLVENVVPIDHHKTIMWLSWLGFVFGDMPTTVNGFECVRFVRCAPHEEVTFQ